MKISVIVPCYNQEAFIAQTLDSIVTQDYPHFEVIVADDGSRDGTPRIVREYARRYPGKVVPVLSPVNRGITANSNAALFATTGDLIAAMAGDDLFLPGKLLLQAEVFADPQVVLSYHPVEIFESDSGKTLYVTNQRANEDIADYRDIILKSGIPGSASVMVRRSAMPPSGYDSRLKSVSDWLFFIEVALQGSVRKVDKVLGRYRKHATGTTARVADLLDETLLVLDLLIEKHPERPELIEICERGKARYLGGEAFRMLAADRGRAKVLARWAEHLHPNWRYRMLVTAATVPLPKWSWRLLNRGKYVIKRWLPYNPA